MEGTLAPHTSTEDTTDSDQRGDVGRRRGATRSASDGGEAKYAEREAPGCGGYVGGAGSGEGERRRSRDASGSQGEKTLITKR